MEESTLSEGIMSLPYRWQKIIMAIIFWFKA